MRDNLAFYFTLLLQSTAYGAVAVVLLLIKVKNYRKSKRKSEKDEESFSIGKKFVVGARICVSAVLSAVGMLFGAKALMLYDNLAVLAMLPVSF